MNTRFFASMVLVCLCFVNGMANETGEAASAVKADAQISSDEATVSIEESLKQEIELGRQRMLKMRGPRDEQMSEIRKINEQVEARKQAILAENETAAELEAEIAELDKALQEKSDALSAIIDGDEEILALRVKYGEAQGAFRRSQIKLREEIARQIRERRQLQQQARETGTEKAAEEAEASDVAETAETVEKE